MTATSARPTFGNWRRPRSAGLGRLGTFASVALGVSLLVTFVVAAIDLRVALVVAALCTVGFVPLLVHDRWGRHGYERLGDVVRWRRHRRRRGHLYVAGPLSRTPSSECRLPGLAARMEVFDASDALGRPFAVVHHPRPGHVAAVIECAPPGPSLIEDAAVDQWVASYGHWLASLGQDGAVVAASVVVETRPDPGVELRRNMLRRVDPAANGFARDTMHDVVALLPSGSARTRVWVTVTWSRSRLGTTGRRSVEELAVDIGQRLPELCNTLGFAGGGRARPVPSERLAAAVRGAFTPSAIPALEDGDELADWSTAGPLSAEATAGLYRHDEATSVTWVMGQAPTGMVRSNVLRDLLAPAGEVPMKRVALLYRPYSPARAAAIVDNDRRVAHFQATQRKMGRTRDAYAVRVAERTAEEEARGAGLVRFGMVVTATTWTPDGHVDRDGLARAVNVVEQRAAGQRILLRRAWRAQETTFLAGLPLGVVLPAHVTVPKEWRDR